MEEMVQDLLVRRVAQGDGIQVVLLHEPVEDIRAQDHRFGDLHGSPLKLIQFRMALDDVIQESQSTPLSA